MLVATPATVSFIDGGDGGDGSVGGERRRSEIHHRSASVDHTRSASAARHRGVAASGAATREMAVSVTRSGSGASSGGWGVGGSHRGRSTNPPSEEIASAHPLAAAMARRELVYATSVALGEGQMPQ